MAAWMCACLQPPEEAELMEQHIQGQALQPGAFAPLPPLLSGSVEPSLAFEHASETMARLEQHLQQVRMRTHA